MTAPVPEGQIVIGFREDGGSFAAIAIENSRTRLPPALLQGRPARMLPLTISRLFSVCRVAQGICALEAVEDAQGLAVPPSVQAARQALIAAEMLVEHAGRSCLDYPQLLGRAPALDGYKRLRRALTGLEALLFPDGDWLAPGGGRFHLDREGWTVRMTEARLAVEAAIFGCRSEALPAGQGWPAWAAATQTPAQGLAALLLADGLAGFGACEAVPLPADAGGMETPAGGCHLTGPLARFWQMPAVASVRAEHGAGLLAHLVARLMEMAAVLDRLERLSPSGGPALPPPRAGICTGRATVEAARGRLRHQVVLRSPEDGEALVESHRIDAPTEWNFAADGPLARGLVGRPTGGDPSGRLRHLVVALDPCVAYRIEAR